MRLVITIESDNVGVSTDEEVAELVRRVAYKVENGIEGGSIIDVNGNKVGAFTYEPSDPEDNEESEDSDNDE